VLRQRSSSANCHLVPLLQEPEPEPLQEPFQRGT
jgi:hypothetical protein